MAEDKLKRINEILEQGIEATGIDIDPTDITKYGFAPEHSSLILEIENLGLLDELQELVGGEEKLGELIQAIAFKQEEVSSRYQTQEFQNFDLEGNPIGKRAYGITTKELQQKEIQDVIKQSLEGNLEKPTVKPVATNIMGYPTDTPTNVVDDFYVVTPEQLSNAIEEIKKGFGDTLPEIQYDTHRDLISELEQTLASQGFDFSDGREDDLRVVLDDWLTGGGTFEDTKFFNNFPKIENLPDPQNIRGFVAAAGGPKAIREGYVIPQYFKDKPNVPYTDTPTNVVDEIPDNIQKLIDEGKVIETKTSSFAFDEANQNTLVIDKSTVTSKEYRELKKFADEFEYMLIKPYKVTNQSTGVKTTNFDVMKSEYFNTYNAKLEKLVPGSGYGLAIYTPHQDQVKNLLSDIYDEYSQYFDKRFELEMYPYKGTAFTDGKSTMLLRQIYIKPEFQGQGIGSEIINKVTDFADELNIPIMLSTDPREKLVDTLPDYYARFGFLDTGEVARATQNKERWLIRQPGELAGKIVEYGELADDFKTYEEALQAARNTDKPLYQDYIIKQITDRGQTVPGLDTPGGSLGAAKLNDPLVFDSWIDNYANTTTSFIDNLPLSTTVKNQFNNLVQGRAKNLATPGGVADAVDVWELGVLGLMIAAVAYKEYDEIPTILTNKAVDMFNSMTGSYGIPPVPKEQYDLDYEFINKVVETGEKFMPTDIIIKKVGDVVKGAAETGAVTGFGYVPPNLTKTDTMETTQKIQPGVQEEKMFEQAKPKKSKATGGAGAKIL